MHPRRRNRSETHPPLDRNRRHLAREVHQITNQPPRCGNRHPPPTQFGNIHGTSLAHKNPAHHQVSATKCNGSLGTHHSLPAYRVHWYYAYKEATMIELTEDQKQAVSSGHAIRLQDNGQEFVIVRADVYDRLIQQGYDDSP